MMNHTGCIGGSKEGKSQLFAWPVGENGAPIISEAPVSMACAVEDAYETSGFESFICAIAATYAQESVLTRDGRPDCRAFKPALFEIPACE